MHCPSIRVTKLGGMAPNPLVCYSKKLTISFGKKTQHGSPCQSTCAEIMAGLGPKGFHSSSKLLRSQPWSVGTWISSSYDVITSSLKKVNLEYLVMRQFSARPTVQTFFWEKQMFGRIELKRFHGSKWLSEQYFQGSPGLWHLTRLDGWRMKMT